MRGADVCRKLRQVQQKLWEQEQQQLMASEAEEGDIGNQSAGGKSVWCAFLITWPVGSQLLQPHSCSTNVNMVHKALDLKGIGKPACSNGLVSDSTQHTVVVSATPSSHRCSCHLDLSKSSSTRHNWRTGHGIYQQKAARAA